MVIIPTRNSDVLQNLNDVCDSLFVSTDMTQVINYLTIQVDNIFDVDHFSLIYRNRDDLWHVEPIVGDMQRIQSFDDIMESYIHQVLSTGSPQYFGGNADGTQVSYSHYELAIPLKQGDRIFGCAIFGHDKKFSKDTIQLFRVFTRRLAHVIVHVDHTQFLNHHNQMLKNQIQEMRAQIQELDAYNHTVAHDLKSPLSVIMLKTNLIEAIDQLSQKSKDQLKDIRGRVDYMAGMIDQLLTLTRVRDETDTFVMVNTDKMLNNVLERFPEIESGRVSLEVQPDLPLVLGHPMWIEELFANLISNAIKYMGENHPNPTIRIHAEKQRLGTKFMITDNGIGIPANQLSGLFNKFQRGEHSHIEGFGLGLAIVHRIVTRLGGTIGVESEEDNGTTFWFTLFSR